MWWSAYNLGIGLYGAGPKWLRISNVIMGIVGTAIGIIEWWMERQGRQRERSPR
jgi:hypothetical protein